LSRLSSDQVAIIKVSLTFHLMLVPLTSNLTSQNPELLAFSQDDTVGTPAKPFGTQNTSPPEFYSGKSKKGTHVFILNTASSSQSKTITFGSVPGLSANTNYRVHDMWTAKDVGTFKNSWSTTLASHDTGAWLITPA
jgi:alpha-galactosidase